MGNLGKLCGSMSLGKTVSKLRSAPAPYLAQAPAPKLGVGVDLNRCRDRVGCLLGPDTVLTRSRSHRGPDRISPRRGRYLPEGRTVSRRDAGKIAHYVLRGISTSGENGVCSERASATTEALAPSRPAAWCWRVPR